MTDVPTTTTGAAPASESRAVVPVRERLIVQAPVAIWDTADFEQMQRVALVLARSGLVPETLCHSGEKDDKGNAIWLPIEVVAARCTLICNQARLWGADPLNVLQCTSLINGRLMYEGKLVAAIVGAMTGVHLRYRFGLWDTDHIEFSDEESALHGAGERLAIRCYDPEDPERFVDGSVGQWKNTRSGSPWSSPANWPRQLRYRGSREWTRAYEPGVLLGILADGDQEVDDFAAAPAPRTVGLIDRLKGEQGGDGFDHDALQTATGGPNVLAASKPRRTRKKADEPAADAAERPTTEGAATETAGAPAAEGEPATSGTAPPASEGGQQGEEGSGPSAEAEGQTQADEGQAGSPDVGEVVTVGHAAQGETYFMAGDGLTADGARLTYRDGVRFSTSKDTEKFPVYEEHAPELPEVEDEEEGIDHQADQPAADPDDDGMDPEVKAAMAVFGPAVEAATNFDTVKTLLQGLRTDGIWVKLDEADQNALRADVWLTMADKFFPADLPDHKTDVSAWRLYIEAEEEADAVEQSLSTLEDSESFKKQADPTKEALRAAAYARINLINAGGEG